jgi:hypothetical protein
VWEHTYGGGFGEGLAFFACNEFHDLGHYRYPDFAYVGTQNVPKWNDRISSYVNNQSNGTLTEFSNWQGYWQLKLGSWAFDYDDSVVPEGWNDMFDGFKAC